MSFQTPRSIEEMLTAIHKREYLMPAIQREFVWGADQITKLVDSLMRGYPVGSFLLWDVMLEIAQSYTFYEFLTNYRERDNLTRTRQRFPPGSKTLQPIGQRYRQIDSGVQTSGGVCAAFARRSATLVRSRRSCSSCSSISTSRRSRRSRT